MNNPNVITYGPVDPGREAYERERSLVSWLPAWHKLDQRTRWFWRCCSAPGTHPPDNA